MTIAEMVQYLQAADANEGEDAIPENEYLHMEDLKLVGWDDDNQCHTITDNGRQWLKQLTKE